MTLLQFDLFGIFSNPTAFLLFFILVGAIVGAISRKLSVASFGGILVFAHVVMNTDMFIFDAILYLILFVIILWGSSFIVSSYFDEDTEA